MRRALALFNTAGDVARHHWLSLLLLGAGTIGLRQVLAFIAGASRREMPFLWRMAARFAFAMITERWVESPHALKNKCLMGAPNASVVHVAFSGILQTLENM